MHQVENNKNPKGLRGKYSKTRSFFPQDSKTEITQRPSKKERRTILPPLTLLIVLTFLCYFGYDNRENLGLDSLSTFPDLSTIDPFAIFAQEEGILDSSPENTTQSILERLTGTYLIDGETKAIDDIISTMSGVNFQIEKAFIDDGESVDLHLLLLGGNLDWNIRIAPTPDAQASGVMIPVDSFVLVGDPIEVITCTNGDDSTSYMAPIYAHFERKNGMTELFQFIEKNNSHSLETVQHAGFILIAGRPGIASDSTEDVSGVFTNLDSSIQNVPTVESDTPFVKSVTDQADCEIDLSMRVAEASLPFSNSNYEQLSNKYGSTLYPTIESMPEDLRNYYLQTVIDVGNFFDVRPQDILAIFYMEQNQAGFRLVENRVSSAGAVGVGQIIACTKIGWKYEGCTPANYLNVSDQSSMRLIVENGGIGFSWSGRDAWKEYQNTGNITVLENVHADVTRFDDASASVANFLVMEGVTNTLYQTNPQAYESKRALAIQRYNGGTAATLDTVQSAFTTMTVGDYVSGAIRASNSFNLEGISSSEQQRKLELYRTYIQDKYFFLFRISISVEEADAILNSDEALKNEVIAGTWNFDQAAAHILSADSSYMKMIMEYNHSLYTQNRQTEMKAPYFWNTASYYGASYYAHFTGHSPTKETLFSLMVLSNITADEHEKIRATLETHFSALSNQNLERELAFLYTGLTGKSTLDQSTSARIIALTDEAIASSQNMFNPYALSPAPEGDLNTELTIEAFLYYFTQALEKSPERQEALARSAEVTSEDYVYPYSGDVSLSDVTKHFGVAVNYQNGGFHTGLDLSRGEGTPIRAIRDGTIAYIGPLYVSGPAASCGSGEAGRGPSAIIINHGGGMFSTYSHGENIFINPSTSSPWRIGDTIGAGQDLIGENNRGCSWGSHLHLEVRTNSQLNTYQNGLVNWQEPFIGGTFIDPWPLVTSSD